MTYETITYAIDERTAVITLNRPEVLNAQNEAMKDELADAFRAADADEDVRVVVLRGAGRAFSSGHDLKAFPRNPLAFGGPSTDKWFEGNTEMVRRIFHEAIYEKCMAIHYTRKPTIAQVHGYCVAGGWLLASMCDLIVASDDARFRDPRRPHGGGRAGIARRAVGRGGEEGQGANVDRGVPRGGRGAPARPR